MNENRKVEFDTLSRKYKKHLDIFESKSLLRQVKGRITEADLYAVAKQLDNTENFMKFSEANGSIGDLGALQKISLGVVLASNIIDPTPIIAGVQPLDSEVGLIYYKDVKAETNKLSNKKGQTLLSSQKGRQNIAVMADGEYKEIVATGDGDTTDFAVTLEYAPVLKRYVAVYLEDKPEIRAIDDGNGVLLGNKVSGTINYETGAVTLSFADAPAKDEKIVVDYQTAYGAETNTEIPTIMSEFKAIEVRARTFALRTSMSILKMFSMEKKLGLSAEEMLSKDLTTELQATIATRVIQQAYASVPATNIVKFSTIPPAGVSSVEHRLSFLTTALPELQGKVLDASGRYVNDATLVCGAQVATYIMGLPGFNGVQNTFNSTGIVFLGTLNGMPIFRTSVLPANEALYVAKGGTELESAIVSAPYLPIFVTDTFQSVDHNPLKTQKAIASSLGIVTPIPGMIAKLIFA